MARLPTYTPGDRFGQMTYIEPICVPGQKSQHRLLCDCGNIAIVWHCNLKRQLSCGCAKGRRPPLSAESRQKIGDKVRKIKPGDTYGEFTVLDKSPYQSGSKGTLYRCRCSCGRLQDVPNKRLCGMGAARTGQPWNLHCKGPAHPQKRLRYPPTPQPYPKEASTILADHMYLLRRFEANRLAHELALDRLIRAAFIVYWRQRYAAPVGDIRRYMAKAVRYCSIDERRYFAAQQRGGVLYNSDNEKIIGSDMTNRTISVAAIIETLPDVLLLAPPPSPKRRRFIRR